MTAPADTTLITTLRLNFITSYKRTDIPTSTTGVKDDLNFGDINLLLANGRGKDKANLQFHSRRRLINSTEVLDLDGGLQNKWLQTLEYDAVKVLIIRNRETSENLFLEVSFKNEKYYIGPTGSRFILEPFGGGIESIVSSASSEEGSLVVSSNGDITYDIIIIGADKEDSSSSSGT